MNVALKRLAGGEETAPKAVILQRPDVPVPPAGPAGGSHPVTRATARSISAVVLSMTPPSAAAVAASRAHTLATPAKRRPLLRVTSSGVFPPAARCEMSTRSGGAKNSAGSIRVRAATRRSGRGGTRDAGRPGDDGRPPIGRSWCSRKVSRRTAGRPDADAVDTTA